HPGIVDQRVHAAEPLDRATDHAVGDRRVGDVAGDRQHVRRGVGLDRPRVGDDPVAAVEEAPDQPRPDPLRRPGDDDDLARSAHDEPPDEGRIPPARVARGGPSLTIAGYEWAMQTASARGYRRCGRSLQPNPG